jgi:hypothetical protein
MIWGGEVRLFRHVGVSISIYWVNLQQEFGTRLPMSNDETIVASDVGVSSQPLPISKHDECLALRRGVLPKYLDAVIS